MQILRLDKTNRFWRFAAGVALAFGVGLALFALVMAPQAADLMLMIELTGITSLVSVLAVAAAYRFGWMVRSPGLRWTLAGGYLLAGLLVFLNVFVTARIMFVSQHDLLLSTVLLVFAGYFAVYIATPQPLPWHLWTSCDRLFLHLLPSLVLLVFLALRVPQESPPPSLVERSQ